ncbi:hypothetical protein BCR24_07640 [Enterococcus ureilyticus]|uniref:Restriction endonuclease type IV Mrr domain-containing protein n=1 Tax=Enterococcus ureilyticus TaxID=1131292 RepID=A0A1E5H8S0_9ENTE|nr:hypothetical protein [Enterococcus ureilyticus]MBM7687496.1 hypothetical protein [Enterococcus ureilyticus]OEG21331.1 hypothetical protein BCR24_07640 [Enterococcus ureilyticus]
MSGKINIKTSKESLINWNGNQHCKNNDDSEFNSAIIIVNCKKRWVFMENEKVSYNERHRKNALRGFAFEDFVLKLLEYYQIEDIKRNYIFSEFKEMRIPPEADFYLNNKIIVEIKCFSTKEISFSQLLNSAKRFQREFSEKMSEDKTFLIIVGNVVDFDRIESFIERRPELEFIEIIDVRNLFYLTRNNDLLTDELTSLLSFSTEDEEFLFPNFNDSILQEMFKDEKALPLKSESNHDYIQELESWEPKGRSNCLEFEKLCVKVLKKLLNDNLMLWDDQRGSSGNMYKFDLICKIKTESSHDFWNILKHHFETRYIIFEFKNYEERITQKEIYTTEKYLYAKVLRSVAIMISPKGEDENAGKAIRGTLRENGKLILSLTIDDLIKMLKWQDSGNEFTPSDYLSEQLDELLIDLEK